MQEPVIAPREQLQPLVKKYLSNWKMVILLGVSCAFIWFAVVMGLFVGHGSGMVFSYMIVALFATLNTCLQISKARFTTRLEHKRQAAAWGDRLLLADWQPAPTAQTLPLPFTMRMRPRWGKLVAVVAILPLLAAACWSIFFVFAFQAATSLVEHAPVVFWSLVISTMLMLPLPVFVAFSLAVRQQITLTEHGIMQVGLLARTKSLPWSQIRLFAVLPVLFSEKSSNQSPVFFEVASADETLQWSWAQSSGIVRDFFFARSVDAPADHEQQLRAMLAVIQARTHLPLYDLRKPL